MCVGVSGGPARSLQGPGVPALSPRGRMDGKGQPESYHSHEETLVALVPQLASETSFSATFRPWIRRASWLMQPYYFLTGQRYTVPKHQRPQACLPGNPPAPIHL